MTLRAEDEQRQEPWARFTERYLSDAEEQGQALPGVERRHLQLSPGRYEGRISRLEMPRVRLSIETQSRAILTSGALDAGLCSVLFTRMPDAAARVDASALGARTLGYVPGGAEIDVQAPPGCESVSAVFDNRTFQEAARVMDEPRWGGGFSQVRLFQRVESEPLSTLFSSIQTAALEGRGSGPLAERTILSAILQAIGRAEEKRDPSKAMKGRLVALRVVARARECMESASEEALTILDVCRLTGVSRRTLQASFEKILGTSPSRYLRIERLSRARSLLRHPSEKTRVTQVAMEQGFWHLGRFARDYYQLFGEHPSQTLKSAKTG